MRLWYSYQEGELRTAPSALHNLLLNFFIKASPRVEMGGSFESREFLSPFSVFLL